MVPPRDPPSPTLSVPRAGCAVSHRLMNLVAIKTAGKVNCRGRQRGSICCVARYWSAQWGQGHGRQGARRAAAHSPAAFQRGQRGHAIPRQALEQAVAPAAIGVRKRGELVCVGHGSTARLSANEYCTHSPAPHDALARCPHTNAVPCQLSYRPLTCPARPGWPPGCRSSGCRRCQTRPALVGRAHVQACVASKLSPRTARTIHASAQPVHSHIPHPPAYLELCG